MHTPRLFCNVVTCIHNIPGCTCTKHNVRIIELINSDYELYVCNGFKARTAAYVERHSCSNPDFERHATRILSEKPYVPQVSCDVNKCCYRCGDNSCAARIVKIDGQWAKTKEELLCCSSLQKEAEFVEAAN